MQDIKRAERPSKKSNKGNAQSAMEYLMTYGWTILVISIVILTLSLLGIFRIGGASSSNFCTPIAPFTCSNPILSSNGVLITQIEELGSTITVNGLGCSGTNTAPSSFMPTNAQLFSGVPSSLSFACNLQSTTIGAPFTGTLWIQYSSGMQTGVTEIGTVSTPVVILGTSPPSAIAYVPITLANSNGATGSNFQQMLTINSQTYNTYINSGWMNVEFTTGPNAAGTVLQAWVESNPSNTATSTAVWVLLPSGLASGSTTIYMDFMSTNVMSSSGPTGEAPQLSGTYAQYDNGASVFANYNNFISSSSISGWTEGGPGCWNGCIETYSASNGLTLTEGPSGYGTNNEGVASTYALTIPFVYEAYGEAKNLLGFSSIGCVDFGLDYATNSLSQIVGGPWFWSPTGVQYACGGSTWEGFANGGYMAISSSPSGNSNTFYVLGQTVTSTNVYWYVNYGQIGSVLYSASSGNYAGFWVDGGDNQFYYWMRTRVYPPSNVMPSATFGAIA